MNYVVTFGDKSTLRNAPVGDVLDNPWDSTFLPETHFQMVLEKGVGFHARLWSYEKNPRITYFENGSEVCEDSCLELFLNFAPQKTTAFINFEMKSDGTKLIGIGPDRYERYDIIGREVMPTVSAAVHEEYWEVELFVPLSLVEEFYGKCDFKPGYLMVGNVFKCGDLTESPHWLAWSPMNPQVSDFHRSDRFGTFQIGE